MVGLAGAGRVLVGMVVWGVCAGCGSGALTPGHSALLEVQDRPYSDAEWAAVLREHVRYGLVDYATLRAAPASLDRYCALVSRTGPRLTPDQFPSRHHATAYYINVFNALVLRAVLSRPEGTLTMHDIGMPRLEYDYRFTVDGGVVTLAEVERRMLESAGGDTRCVMATTRASMGSPRLAGEPFRGDNLERQLTEAAASCLDTPTLMRIDHSGRSIRLWQTLLWRQNELLEFWKERKRVRILDRFQVLIEMASPQQRRALASAIGYTFTTIEYDRRLNAWQRKADRPSVP